MKKIKHKANEREREETMINPRGGGLYSERVRRAGV